MQIITTIVQLKKPLVSELPIPDCGYLKATNQGEGFKSIGWRFSPRHVFNHNKLYDLLNGIVAERLKAVFITNKSIFAYNLTPDALMEFALDECMESRIEIIANQLDEEAWEIALLECLINAITD